MKVPTVTYRRFTVEEKDGRVVRTTPIPDTELPLWARDVSQKIKDWSKGPDPKVPYFQAPIRFVHPPKDKGEPFYVHNHVPSIVWCENGDLLSTWYTCRTERGSELTILASRLRDGAENWDPSSEFFKAEKRNMHVSVLSSSDKGMLYNFNGMSPKLAPNGYDRLALVLRTSTDMGVAWTQANVIFGEYSLQHIPSSATGSMFRTSNGLLVLPCERYSVRTATLVVSEDDGQTWTDMAKDMPLPEVKQDSIGRGWIAGAHAGVIEISSARLMALGRDGTGKFKKDINGRMPKSISSDWGKTWTYSASPFPPIGMGQRLALMRLSEGPILLVSFTATMKGDKDAKTNHNGLSFHGSNGKQFMGYGMFAALSFDEGETWPVQKLLTPGSGRYEKCGGWTGNFTASSTQAEPGGYLSATQTPDGVIHLLTSANHYRFNLAWLKTPNSPGGLHK
jgi:hypothetical protein